jgi:preprotein translocase subunit SecD
MLRSTRFTSALAALVAVSCERASVARISGDPIAHQQPILQLRLAQETPRPGFVRMEFLGRTGGVYVAERSVVSDDGIEHIDVEPTADGLLLDVQFSPEGAARLAEATRAAVGLHLAVLATSRLVGAARIVGPLSGERRVTMEFHAPPELAQAIAASIAARWRRRS